MVGIKVETFEELETTGLAEEAAADPAALALIESLGLEGQRSRVVTRESSGTETRCPYRMATVKEYRVYTTLFPEKCAVEAYDAGMIPLRVLQVAAHAKDLGIYSRIEVWSERTKPKDPLLMGRIGSEYSDKVHILARWGEALEDFDTLFLRAADVIANRLKMKAQKEKREAEALIADPVPAAFEWLGGEWVSGL